MLLGVALNIAFVFLPIYGHALTDPSGWISTGLTVALGFAAILSLYAMLLYNNRLNQIRWVKRAMMFQVIAIGICFAIFFTLGTYGFNVWDEILGVSILFLALLCQYAAIHFIRKDENLVRSVDRLR